MELVFKKQGFIIYKLIPCLIITMFAFMCLYGSFVYATEYIDSLNGCIVNDNTDSLTITYNNNTRDFSYIKQQYSYYFISCSTNPDFTYIFCSNYPFTLDDSSESMRVCSNSSCDFFDYYYGFFSLTNNASIELNHITNLSYAPYHSSSRNIVFSNCDILTRSGNVVFQAPPQVQDTQAIIAEQVGEVEMNKTLQEILGILPVVIVVLVGLIAIRKGIIFLIALMKRQ